MNEGLKRKTEFLESAKSELQSKVVQLNAEIRRLHEEAAKVGGPPPKIVALEQPKPGQDKISMEIFEQNKKQLNTIKQRLLKFVASIGVVNQSSD
jgi:16S rRNA G527 N7-methylase RsmG